MFSTRKHGKFWQAMNKPKSELPSPPALRTQQKRTWYGDANLDGEFDSRDLSQVLAAGKYETGQATGWDEGDWNGDVHFGTGDFVTALIEGGYERGPKQPIAAVPEPTSALLFVISLIGIVASGRRDQN